MNLFVIWPAPFVHSTTQTSFHSDWFSIEGLPISFGSCFFFSLSLTIGVQNFFFSNLVLHLISFLMSHHASASSSSTSPASTTSTTAPASSALESCVIPHRDGVFTFEVSTDIQPNDIIWANFTTACTSFKEMVPCDFLSFFSFLFLFLFLFLFFSLFFFSFHLNDYWCAIAFKLIYWL